MSCIEPFLAETTAFERWNGINEFSVIKGKDFSQLMLACYQGNTDSVERLLKKVPGIKIDLQNDEGWHSLMCACACGNTKVAELILKACHNNPQLTQHLINLPNKNLFTSLMVASGNGHTDRASLLIKKGASTDLQTISGLSSLMLASFFGHIDIVLLLLRTQKWC